MQTLLLRIILISCLLISVTGCASIRRTQSSYVFENITPTCAYKALEEMEGITKVWMSYNYLPPFPTISRAHLVGQDGIEFDGEKFFGFISIHSLEPTSLKSSVRINVYSNYGFLYRNFALWDLDEILPRIERTKESIKDVLLSSCNSVKHR